MKLKNEWYKLYIDLYETQVVLYIGDTNNLKKQIDDIINSTTLQDKDYFIDCIRNNVDKTLSNFCLEMVSEKNELCVLICIQNLNIRNIDDLGILCHETFHAANYILNYIGATDYKEGANEPMAYLQEYIFREFLNIIYNNKKR